MPSTFDSLPSGVACSQDSLSVAQGQPSVSFIIPVLNDQANIERCVRSILALKCPRQEYEIIVLDNGSTDGTHRVLQKFGLPFHVIQHVHVSALRNRGARCAKGHFLAFIDSDVEVSPDWIVKSLEEFRDPGVVAAGCFPEIPEQATWVQRAWDIHQRGRQSPQTGPVAWLPSMNLMVRRDAFLTIGGFNEQLETAEDVDLCYRLSEKGMILNNPSMKAVHWGEASTLVIFWKKEVWRGIGNVKGLFSHGLRFDELPSLGYPVYTLLMVLGSVIGGIVDLRNGQWLWSLVGFGLLVLPGILLTVNTIRKAGQVHYAIPLFTLYVIYGLARACSLVKACFPRGKHR